MRFVIQRVKNASVQVDNKIIGKIDKGLVVLIGIAEEDNESIADYYVKKLINLRIFEDRDKKMNLSLKDIDGELLLISQFTLYADIKKGNRPSFIEAAKPDKAEKLYDYVVEECRKRAKKVDTGIFGANMQVELVNDGPVTIVL